MTLPVVAAAVMLVALIIYAVSAGADFGGGVWHLASFGERAKQQRQLIDDAIGPIWEANHVWLILIVVLLFVCFPVAFAAASVALHIPLTLMLIGIVLRGAGFSFRHYAATVEMRRRWSRAFSIASAATPFFLGLSLAAVSSERLIVRDGISANGFVAPWLHPFGIAVGCLTVALFAFIAAVYLAREAVEVDLRDDFRARALVAGVAVGVFAFSALALAPLGFRVRLLSSWWSAPLQIVTAIVSVSTLLLLVRRNFGAARIFVVAQCALILGGWAAAQAPMLIAPSLSIAAAAAPDQVIRLTLAALAVGSLLLAPSFCYLFRVFKT